MGKLGSSILLWYHLSASLIAISCWQVYLKLVFHFCRQVEELLRSTELLLQKLLRNSVIHHCTPTEVSLSALDFQI